MIAGQTEFQVTQAKENVLHNFTDVRPSKFFLKRMHNCPWLLTVVCDTKFLMYFCNIASPFLYLLGLFREFLFASHVFVRKQFLLRGQLAERLRSANPNIVTIATRRVFIHRFTTTKMGTESIFKAFQFMDFGPLLVGVGVSLVLLMWMLIGKNFKIALPKIALPKKEKKGIKKPKIRGAICPYSAETDFLVETAKDLAPAPLDLYESWIDPESKDFGLPLGARWLNAGLSGQDTPGMLRAGLKRLGNSKFFLVEEPFLIREELLMKEKALDDPKRYPKVFVAEDDSLEAQKECLLLFLSYLPRRYPDLYDYDHKANTIHVVPIDKTFAINDWIDTKPLELCERIVQEDLVLMRPPKENEEDQYAMAAAAVVFSFSELKEKLGKPVTFIHAPVPGYEKFLKKTLHLTFKKLLKVERPMWRNNWGISPSGSLDEPLYGSEDATAQRQFKEPTREEIKAKFLKVEYQTIRRLPKSGYLLFTVKTMVDPLPALEKVPKAASCLAASIRGMGPAMRKYKGIEDDPTSDAVLAYLDSIGPRNE